MWLVEPLFQPGYICQRSHVTVPCSVGAYVALPFARHPYRARLATSLFQNPTNCAMSTPQKKTKLRTAGDVISRLRWSSYDDHGIVLMGYLDRIEGPMEKNVNDYVAAADGGDVPEHRIIYFRRDDGSITGTAQQVLWDRKGRVDRIFRSGDGSDAAVSLETIESIQQAIRNMARLEEEQEELRKLKTKKRAQAARKRATAAKRLNPDTMGPNKVESTTRFDWVDAPWYVYSQDCGKWIAGGSTAEQTELDRIRDLKVADKTEDLVVLTWNVLFDIFDKGLDDHTIENIDPIEDRYELLCSMLEATRADLISLQEVTPSFVAILCDAKWVQSDYASSVSPQGLKSVCPSGVALLWRRSTLQPVNEKQALAQCSDVGRSRCLTAALSSPGDETTLVYAATHLPADKAVEAGVSPGEKETRKLARKRELSSILGQCERLQSLHLDRSQSSVTTIIAGDFNCEDDELVNGLFAGADAMYRDVWPAVSSSPGSTFDPLLNPRAARSSRLVGSGRRPRRIDRVFVGSRSICPKQTLVAQYIPKSGDLVGNEFSDTLPPSDHFGVRASFQKVAGTMPYQATRSTWAANAPPSLDYILALVLDNPKLEAIKTKYALPSHH